MRRILRNKTLARILRWIFWSNPSGKLFLSYLFLYRLAVHLTGNSQTAQAPPNIIGPIPSQNNAVGALAHGIESDRRERLLAAQHAFLGRALPRAEKPASTPFVRYWHQRMHFQAEGTGYTREELRGLCLLAVSEKVRFDIEIIPMSLSLSYLFFLEKKYVDSAYNLCK